MVVHAQITGELRGAVSDPSGAAIPKATVTLTNLETRQVRTQSANSEGEFSFDLLGIGNYEVEAAAPGFSPEKLRQRSGQVKPLRSLSNSMWARKRKPFRSAMR